MRDVALDRERPSPPHAPPRGSSARVLGRFHVTGVFWYRFHLWGVSTLPSWLVGPTVKAFTLFFFLLLRRIRKAIATNLVPVLGPCGFLERERRIHRTMSAFAWCLTERYEHASNRGRPEVRVENREAWDELVHSRNGFIVLTAHLGNWEVASSLLTVHSDCHVHLVREEEMTPEAQKFVGELAQSGTDHRFTTHFAGDPSLGIVLADALKRGEVVALQGDRPRAGGRTIRAPLFGRELDLPIGPLVLARLSGAPVLPAFAFREGRWRYLIAFREPIRVGPTDENSDGLAEGAAAVARSIEWAIARAPHQWFRFAEAWREGEGRSSRNHVGRDLSTQ
jgi:phosphatidylinositol dimannoside acyltransferase